MSDSVQHEMRYPKYLDHANVIGTIPDSEGHDTQAVLDEPDNQSLLQRRYSTANDTLALSGERQKKVTVSIVRECLMT